jgi:adenine-specific DNA-methyltransferase
MPRKAKSTTPTPVESVKHKDTRKNIPTSELSRFVADDEKAPKTILYPRDPSLDPQLVWQGKDEQDSRDLAVPCVPVYIQEKIHPQALIENLRDTAKEGETEPELALFDDFNGIHDFGQKVEFYQHDQNWSNRMILGDSLLVMTSLAEKEGLKGKVQMIYLDPPYGIKFGSNWQVSTRRRDVKDGKVEDATREPEQIKAFRDTWKLGIHSYLAYWRDRLIAARDLLTETGSVFLQIGDENVHLVRCLLDEVFGSENFVSLIAVRKTTSEGSTLIGSTCDFLVWYGKRAEQTKFRAIYQLRSEGAESRYDQLAADGRFYRLDNITSSRPAGAGDVRSFTWNGLTFGPGQGTFKTTALGLERLAVAGRLHSSGRGKLNYRRFQGDFGFAPVANLWADISGAVQSRSDPKVYVVQTSTSVIERCLLMTTDPGDLVLDPTCGSGTTAYVAEQWGRRWITIDTSRVALALARTRLMSGRYPYYILADSPEGVQKEAEVTGVVPSQQRTEGDVRKGFVCKRISRITLKSIANNEEIDGVHTRWQGKLEPVRAKLNKAVKQSWEEWQIPRDADEEWSPEAKRLHGEWWSLRQQRQQEIDDSIARQADTELLYDQPYEDNKRVRVSGPFTVESLSPHRVIATDEERPVSEREAQAEPGPGQFENMIIENLRKAGVQNTVRQERLRFDRLESYPGQYLQASGEYTEGDTSKSVVICIGPEHGTVAPDLIKDSAKEALEGKGFDLLLVCGFAFDPHSGETAKQFSPEKLKKSDDFATAEEVRKYGKLPVLLVRINADLAMGDEFLKRTGAGNLFMVFGEPDVALTHTDDGKLIVEVKGVDVYDPTTGEIRSHTTDQIACWFIDTNYDGDSFFVRHAYFTGAEEPYEKLKRALKAEIDEAAWATLYSTISRPFAPPTTGKIAIKVINHYGDEVLKVYEVQT